MHLQSIKKITPEPSRCISVDSYDRLFEVGEGNNKILTRNSVAQQNIVISCLLRPEYWVILGIDLKRVELTRYRDFGMKVATELDSAIEFLRFSQAVMMKRYQRMEELGVNDFRDLPESGQALLVMVDEAGELLSPTGAKTDEAKAMDELKGEAIMIIGSIARLGRAAGVHMVVATQRPDAKLIPGEVRANLAARMGCGNLKSSTSLMLFESNIGERIHSDPPGGVYIQIHGNGNMGQGFYAPDAWLKKYYDSHGITDPKTHEHNIGEIPSEHSDVSRENPVDTWDDEMDSLHDD